MPADVRAAHIAIVTAVSEGRLTAVRLAEAVTRVVALMIRHGDEPAAPPPSVIGTHGSLSYLVSLAGLTLTDVLTGRVAGGGTLPVAVPNVERTGCG